LKSRAFYKSLLKRVELTRVTLSQSLNRLNATSLALDGQERAGWNRLSVHENRAGTTRAPITAHLRTGEAEGLPERLGKRMVGGHFPGMLPDPHPVDFTVDREGYGIPVTRSGFLPFLLPFH